MKNKTSELNQLLEVIKNQNLSFSEAIERIKNGNQVSEVQLKPVEEMNLTVNYSQTVRQMIRAATFWWKDDINEKNFPLPDELKGRTITVESKLLHFNRVIRSSEYAISETEKTHYRSANLFELLALGAKYPELQKQFPIVALGSVWSNADDCRRVPCLIFDDYTRKLNLTGFDHGWLEHYRFLVVRK